MAIEDDPFLAFGSESISKADENGFARLRSVKRDVIARQEKGWETGSPPSIAELLDLWPANPAADPDAASLIAEDFLQRKCRGEEPSLQDYQAAYPEYKDSCAALIVARSMMTASIRPGRLLRLPSEGDALFGFRLARQLGQGTFARFFLAEQARLAGRPVVLKISAIEGDEPQTLAQLQHTSIVPIYSVHEDQNAGLRGLHAVPRRRHPHQRARAPPKQDASAVQGRRTCRCDSPGRDIDSGRRNSSRAASGEGQRIDACPVEAEGLTPVDILRRTSFFQAAAWIVAQLADGLQHAHNRGILHRDIKPSNILISDEGQPLLLDFNLAQDQRLPAEQATVGGTIAYMSPEHLRAMIDQGPAQAVDQRSDIYSLGMVLGEDLDRR